MKSILITETPTECRDCPCINGYDFGVYCGKADKKLTYDYEALKFPIPEWCPLIPLPEPKDLTKYCHRGDSKSMTHLIQYVHDQGYNDCLYELSGGNL